MLNMKLNMKDNMNNSIKHYLYMSSHEPFMCFCVHLITAICVNIRQSFTFQLTHFTLCNYTFTWPHSVHIYKMIRFLRVSIQLMRGANQNTSKNGQKHNKNKKKT